MTVKEFELKYRNKGGIAKLTELRSFFYSHTYIATHFGVGRNLIRVWMKELFGTTYDPRPDRAETIISNMVSFARNNNKDDFRRAFRSTTYYIKALEECVNQGIYEQTN